jgi:hypothetical protein
MGAVTFATYFRELPAESVRLDPRESLKYEIGDAIYRNWDRKRNPGRIMEKVEVQDPTNITFKYQTPESIRNHHTWEIEKTTLMVRNGMLYRQSTCCQELDLRAVWVPIASLVRKVFVPLIFSIPSIYYRCGKLCKESVDREMKANLPLKALAGFVGQLCLSILWFITLGIFSPWINYLRGDIERWENGHTDQVGKKSRRERCGEMPYLMELAQPITMFNAATVPSGEVDLMTTPFIPENHRNSIARHIAAKSVNVKIDERTVPVDQFVSSDFLAL